MVASLVPNTSAYPWSTVVDIVATFPSGGRVSGSGAVVDRNNVLTASHVVYDAAKGGAATSVEVIPGRDGDARPFGSFTASDLLYYDWNLDNNRDSGPISETAYDIALLSFSEELGARTGGWMGIASLGANGAANLTGYPGTTPAGVRDGTRMWSDSGAAENIGDGVLRTKAVYATNGNSGGPLWTDADPGPGVSPSVVGITVSVAENGWAYFASTGSDNPYFGALLDKLRSDDALLSGQLFDAPFYLGRNADVRAAAVDSRAHYMTQGWREGRDPNAWFDTDGYLAAYADVRAAGLNPLEHYRTAGWREGRDPSTAFDTGSYLAAYADVRAAGLNPLDHYLRIGQAEGRLTFGDGTWL